MYNIYTRLRKEQRKLKEIRTIVVHWIDEDEPSYISDDPREGIIWRCNYTFVRILALPHNEDYILKDIWFDDGLPEWVMYAIDGINSNAPDSRACFDAVWDWDENED